MFNGSYLRVCSNQMVNTRRGSDQQQRQNNQGQNNQGTGIPMPPPLTSEQYFQLQMQMMATLNNTIQALQPSCTSGAGSTALGSGVEASVSRYPGCSAPAAGQNHAWCSPSDLNKRCMSKDIEEIIQMDMITFCKKDLGMIK